MLRGNDDGGHSRMLSLDPKSKQAKVFGTNDYYYEFMDSFVESLVMLDHANAISYRCKHRVLL